MDISRDGDVKAGKGEEQNNNNKNDNNKLKKKPVSVPQSRLHVVARDTGWGH